MPLLAALSELIDDRQEQFDVVIIDESTLQQQNEADKRRLNDQIELIKYAIAQRQHIWLFSLAPTPDPITPELIKVVDGYEYAHIGEKDSFSIFGDSEYKKSPFSQEFCDSLHGRNLKNIVLAGFNAQMCVKESAISALKKGLEVFSSLNLLRGMEPSASVYDVHQCWDYWKEYKNPTIFQNSRDKRPISRYYQNYLANDESVKAFSNKEILRQHLEQYFNLVQSRSREVNNSRIRAVENLWAQVNEKTNNKNTWKIIEDFLKSNKQDVGNDALKNCLEIAKERMLLNPCNLDEKEEPKNEWSKRIILKHLDTYKKHGNVNRDRTVDGIRKALEIPNCDPLLVLNKHLGSMPKVASQGVFFGSKLKRNLQLAKLEILNSPGICNAPPKMGSSLR